MAEKVVKHVSRPAHDLLSVKGPFYESLYEKNPELRKYKPSQIKRIITNYNQSLWNYTLDNPDGLMLPLRTGTMSVVVHNVSWTYNKKLSIQTGEKIRYANQHSDGMGGGVYYSAWDVDNHRPLFSGSCYWHFKPCRLFNRSIAKKFFSGEWRMYKKVGKTRKLREAMQIYKTLSNIRRMEHFFKERYDEFDFSD